MFNKNVIFLFIFTIASCSAKAKYPNNGIALNQCGFYQYAPKIAVVTGATASNTFYLVSASKKDTVFTGELQQPVSSAYSSTITRIADFSSFDKTGIYILFVKDIGYSVPFPVHTNVHHALSISSLKGFYYQRVSMPLEKQYAGEWSRPAGHPDTAVVIHPSAATTQRPEGTIISSPKGWYDAGDYNKYIVNSGITMGTMLSAYEDFSAYYDTLKTNIPESSNRLPDLLDEVLYNLRWMLTMQDPNDGGVYHKCTNAAFDGVVMPGVTKLPRYAVQKGTAATLDFAAVMAQSARVFAKFENQLPGLSDSCLRAALYAWHWAEQNPDAVYDQNALNAKYKPAITTGAYGDKNFTDELYWAASELLVTTKDEKFLPAITSYLPQKLVLPSWNNVGMLGYYSLLRNEAAVADYASIDFTSLRSKILSFTDTLIATGGNKAFGTIMGQTKFDFIWGSNAVAMNQSVALINAYQLSGDKKYINAALTNLDYVMGRNATGFCFVTGMGARSPMHIHHRPSQADGIIAPVPGLLAGGPNPGMQDKCTYPFTEPETAYTDDDCSYASNEIAINWNAPLVYVAGAMEALRFAAGFNKTGE